jgi:hypothetical protein
MPRVNRAVCGAAAVLAFAAVAPASAHGFGHVHPWGLGRGLLGAVVGLATLPIALAAAALSVDEPQAPYQAPYQAPGYAPGMPAPAFYPAPQTYYAPRPAYYPPPAPAYYGVPRAAYYSPRAPYYAPRANYGPRPGYYGSRGSYAKGGYAYPHR